MKISVYLKHLFYKPAIVDKDYFEEFLGRMRLKNKKE